MACLSADIKLKIMVFPDICDNYKGKEIKTEELHALFYLGFSLCVIYGRKSDTLYTILYCTKRPPKRCKT